MGEGSYAALDKNRECVAKNVAENILKTNKTSVSMKTDKAIKTGLIGFGLSGRVFHAPFLHLSQHFDLSVITQRSGETAKQSYPSVGIVKSHQEILNDPSIELVVVATPNEYHFEMAKQALAANKHVIIEKPFSPTTAETSELISLAETGAQHLFVFHNRRWDGDFLTVKKIIQDGLIGDVVEYEARYHRFNPSLNPKPWKEIEGPASGILYDLGTHIIDQAVCLFGTPQTVTARLYQQRQGSQVDDAFDVRLDYPSTKVTLKSTLLAKDPNPRYIVYGNKGSFIKPGVDPQEDDMQAGLLPDSPRWGIETIENWGTLKTSVNDLEFNGTIETLRGNYMGFYDNVYDVIRHGGNYAIDPHEAQITTTIIEAAIESHRLGKTICFD